MARELIAYIARKSGAHWYSWSAITEAIGLSSHTSVRNAFRRAERKANEDQQFAHAVSETARAACGLEQGN